MGFFSKLKEVFKKTKTAWNNKMTSLFSHGELDDEFFEELEDILITSDVGVNTAEEIVFRLRERTNKTKLRTQEDVKQALREIVTDILSETPAPEVSYPIVYLIVGVNGVGKTTTIGKLAHYYKQLGHSVLLVAGDTFRAAAGEQLTQWATRNNVKIMRNQEGSDPASVVFDGIKSAKAKGNDVVIVDTAGRLQNKVNLMNELTKISKVVSTNFPEANYQKLLVIDATTGQNALTQVELFDEAVGIDGIILTKIDGTAKGGVVLPIAQDKQKPVVFLGTGEHIEDLEEFDPKTFAEAII